MVVRSGVVTMVFNQNKNGIDIHIDLEEINSSDSIINIVRQIKDKLVYHYDNGPYKQQNIEEVMKKVNAAVRRW